MTTTPADAIGTEIHQLVDLQIRVSGQPTPLTSYELEDCRRRAEQIKLLGQHLIGITTVLQKRSTERRGR